jgi:4'-phosphopantetheinyl transferase EntD
MPTLEFPSWMIPPGETAIADAEASLAQRGHAVLLIDHARPPESLPKPLPGEIVAPRQPGQALRRRIARAVLARWRGLDPGSLTIVASADGAPLFEDQPEIHLSFSTRGDHSLIGIASQPIGVDIETMIETPGIPWNVLRLDEHAVLLALPDDERAPAFIRLWSAKEAIAKALRSGFILPPESMHLKPSGKFAVADRAGALHALHASLRQARLGSNPDAIVSFALLPNGGPSAKRGESSQTREP